MNPDLWRRVACDGKKPFASFKQAKKAAGRKVRRNAYHCRFCGAFHVGSIDRPRQPYHRPAPRRDDWAAESFSN